MAKNKCEYCKGKLTLTKKAGTDFNRCDKCSALFETPRKSDRKKNYIRNILRLEK